MQLNALNQLNDADFIQTLSGIFEHSAWVAAAVLNQRPFLTVADLHQAMANAIVQADDVTQEALLKAHPALGIRQQDKSLLTAASCAEQTRAGLDQCSEEEFETLTTLNRCHEEQFGFPFIIAVKGYTRSQIIAACKERLLLDAIAAKREALAQINQIGWWRLQTLLTAASTDINH